MKPEVEKGDIVNLTPYHFYMKVSGDESEDALSGTTIQLDVGGSDEARDEVIENSRKQYATPKAEVEEHLYELLGVKKAEKKPVTEKSNKPKIESPAPDKEARKKVLHGI